MFGARDRVMHRQDTVYSACNRILRAHTEHTVVARILSDPGAVYIAHISGGSVQGVREPDDALGQVILASIAVSDGNVSFLGPCVNAGSFKVNSPRRGEVCVELGNPHQMDITYGLSLRLVSITSFASNVTFP